MTPRQHPHIVELPEIAPRVSEMSPQTPRVPNEKSIQGDVSEKRENTNKRADELREIERQLQKLLRFDDIGAFRIVLGTVAAYRLPGASVWLMLVGPPSGAKTELIETLGLVEGVYEVSDLTEKTFASGAVKAGGDDASLLARIQNGILTMKDFTTVLSMRRDKRKEILAQLREIYDGKFHKDWGTSKRFEWKGRISVITGVTSEIDRHYGAIGALGQRFVLLRVQQPNRHAAALHALDANSASEQLRENLQGLVGRFFDSLDLTGDGPTLPARYKQQLAALAEFSTRARTPTVRSFSRQFEYAPEDPEGAARLAKQLHSLARGLAAIEGRSEVNDADMALIRRVAIDSLPTIPRTVVLDLAGRVSTTVEDLHGRHKNVSETILRRALEDLEAFGVVERLPAAAVTEPDLWQLSPADRRLLRAADDSAVTAAA